MAKLYYASKISDNMARTPENYLVCMNVPIARIGSQEYTRAELKIEGDPNELVQVYRDEKDVFDPATIASFEGKPTADGHPPEDITAANFGYYAKGHAQDVRRGTGEDSDKLLADLFFVDPQLIDEIMLGKRDISCGYTAEFVIDGEGVIFQREIRGNHIAVVGSGRAGHSVSIKDEQPQPQERSKFMAISRETPKGKILGLFARSIKDASPEEVTEIVSDAESLLETVSAEKKEESPVKEEVKVEQQTADNDPIKGVLDAIAKLSDEFAAFKAGQTAPAEPPVTDNDDPLKKLIALLESGQTPNVSDSDGDEGETSGVIDSANAAELDAPDGSESVGDRAPVKDATANIIKAVYPAVVKIEDAAIRKEVQDALLGAFYKETQDNYGKVLGAVTKKAAQNVNDSANGGEIDLDAQQAAYDNLNPHKKKA